MMCPALKMAIRTHMQLKMSVSKVRQRDHQVQRNRKMKKYTAEVSEGSMIPASTNTVDTEGYLADGQQATAVRIKQTPPACLEKNLLSSLKMSICSMKSDSAQLDVAGCVYLNLGTEAACLWRLFLNILEN